MYDQYNRQINYLRVSVTDRCNLRCSYCMPQAGIKLLRHEDILSLEEIYDLVKIAAEEFGFTKVRLTGGEPLLRKDIMALVNRLGAIKAIADYTLTTNGILLTQYARELKAAGIKRINISLDTLDQGRYARLTCGGTIARVLDGIEAAIDAGFNPIKINCVVEDNHQEPDAQAVAGFAHERNLSVRYIKKMDLGRGVFSVVNGGSGGDCCKCNRLRLSSDGKLYPCLFNNLYFSVRELGAREALRQAIAAKPLKGESSKHNAFYRLGG